MMFISKSVFLGSKFAIAQMLAQELRPSGGRGWMMNISSIMALIGGPINRMLSPPFVDLVLFRRADV